MTFVRTLALVLGATLVPTVAMADVQGDPNDPRPTPKPARSPTATVVMPTPAGAQPPPPQAQTPIVIVNPNPRVVTVAKTPPPERYYELHEAWNQHLFTSGAVVFAGTYGVSAIVAATSDHNGSEWLWIPVAGPWIALADWDNNCPLQGTNLERPSCASTGDQILLGISGGLQAFALVTMIGGRFISKHETKYVSRAEAKKEQAKVHVTPTHNGVAVMGRF